MQDHTRTKGKYVWVNLPPLQIWYPFELLAPREVSPGLRDELDEDGEAVKKLSFVRYITDSGQILYKFPKPVRSLDDIKVFDGPWMYEYTRKGSFQAWF
jgi:hypothetical protein